MKRFRVFLILTYFFSIVISCKDEVPEVNSGLNLSIVEQKLSLNEMAKILCYTFDEIEDINSIKSYVEMSIDYGLDEEVRLKELLDPVTTKVIEESQKSSSTAVRKFRKVFESDLKSANSIALKNAIDGGNLQIYWPYSENWNGKELPVFTFNPGTDQESNVGYSKIVNTDGSSSIEQVIVDEDYAKIHPVFIIGINETDYDHLPFFSKGERQKDGMYYAQKSALETAEFETETLRVQLGWIKCTYQWDAFWNGGPEFVSQWVGIGTNNFDLDYMDKVTTKLSRSDVNKGRWLRIYQTTNSEWLPEENENFFVFYEEDNTFPREDLKGKLNVTENVVLEYNLPFGNKNEILKEAIWSRNAYYNEAKGINDPNAMFRDGWKVFSNSNTWWTMPYVIN